MLNAPEDHSIDALSLSQSNCKQWEYFSVIYKQVCGIDDQSNIFSFGYHTPHNTHHVFDGKFEGIIIKHQFELYGRTHMGGIHLFRVS